MLDAAVHFMATPCRRTERANACPATYSVIDACVVAAGDSMTRDSRLHVPRPPARPGSQPDFSYLATSPAGALKRPEVTAGAREIDYLSTEMVRVLDEQHTA